ncbi:MAG TPA: hypothetical protein VHE35_23400, partial [Kofleriaceae bacterium]|nr:hypothetical protein [Kofleriaceae bacterium]
AQVQAAEHERRRTETALALELRERDATLALELRERDAAQAARAAELDAAQRRRLAEIDALGAADRLQQALVTVGLPALASAFQQSFGEIHYTQLGGVDGGPAHPIASAFAQLLAIARSFGLDPASLASRRPPG